MPTFLLGALGNLGGAGGGLLSVLSRLVSFLPVVNILAGGLSRLTVVATALGAALGIVVGVTAKATGELKSLGNAIVDLRAATGMSAGGSSRLINAYSNAGMSSGAASGMLGSMNPIELQMRARMFGSTPGNVAGMAAGYQRMNPLIRNQMLGSMDSPEMRRVLMQDPNAIRGNQAFGNQVRGGLNLDPETFSRTAQRLDLVTTRFRILGESVLVKLADAALPRLINVLDFVAERIADRSDAIGTGIEEGVNKGFEALINVGDLISRFPEMFFALADSVLSFAQTAIGAIPTVWDVFLQGISVTQNGLESLWRITGQGFSYLLNLSQTLSGAFVQMVAIGEEAWARIQGPLGQVFGGIIGFLDDLAAHPIAQRFLRAAGALPKVAGAAAAASNAAQSDAENALNAAGVPSDWSALGGMVLPGLTTLGLIKGGGMLLKGAGSLLGIGGGAAGAGAAGAGAAGAGRTALGSAMANPWGRAVGVGLGLGVLGYNELQTRGLAGPNAAPWQEALPNSWGRLRDIVTRNPGHYERSHFEQLHRQAAGQSQTPVSDAVDKAKDYFGGLSFSGMGGMRLPSFQMPDIGGMAGGAFNSFMNAPRSSWANNLESKFGTGSQLQSQAQSGLDALREDLNKARDAYDGDEVRRTLRELLGETKKQTDLQREVARGNQGATDAVHSQLLLRFSRERGAAIRRRAN